jgi:sodium-dependent multivitamin transporter 6
MTYVDWAVVALYLGVIVGFAALKSRGQRNLSDYYLAGRGIKWWQSGMSTMATQLGAISFVSAPAFVAVKQGGGLKWLCYEFGVPLGLLAVILLILPTLHRGGYISIYEYLERRFDRGTKTLVSIMFQLGRGLATAVSILAGGLIISTALPLSTAQAIVIVGVVTIIYDVLGGIRVVILSDVLQMIVIGVGILICGGAALSIAGWNTAWAAMGPERLRILDFGHAGLTSEGQYSFWPMVIGGIFLYASYYGCDQSQVQRELSVGTPSGVKKSLLMNAFGRFPVVLLYCLMGVFVGAVFTVPEHIAHLASKLHMSSASVASTLEANPDRMIPMFVLAFLPAGVVGLVFVAILSALMSSLDSAINSLSAVTMNDFYKPYLKPLASDRHYLIASKALTLLWGIFCVVMALAFAGAGSATRQTTIVLINAVGSLLYGPILSAFVLGMLVSRVRRYHIKVAVLAGVAANVLLWRLTPISWLWWNAAGFVVSSVFAIALSYFWAPSGAAGVRPDLVPPRIRLAKRWTVSSSVVLYFVLIVLVAYAIETFV